MPNKEVFMRGILPVLIVILLPQLISANTFPVKDEQQATQSQSRDPFIHRDPPIEGFESGDFSSFPWVNSVSAPWTVQSEEKHSGTYAARSGMVGPFGHADLTLTLDIATAGNISFYEKVSSESMWDHLRFFIDGVLIAQWSGEWPWTQHSYAVGSGIHTFLWRYEKEGSVDAGSDCVWIDDISFPATASFYAPPRNLAASSYNGYVTLSWEAPAFGTPTQYKIFRNGSLLTTVGELGYTDSQVVNETFYSYYVTSVYAGGESLASNPVSALPTAYEESFAVIGSDTTSTSGNAACPVNVSYQSLHGQSVYTAAELTAAGIIGDNYITRIGFFVTGLPTLAMPNFVIRVGHTTASNAESWMSTGLTQVLHISSYLPSSTGWNMLTLDTPFIWDGIRSLLIDTAFGDIGSAAESGTTQYSSVNNGYRYIRDNSYDQTGIFTGGNSTNQRPNLRLAILPYSSGPLIETNPGSLSYGDVAVGLTITQQFTIHNGGDATLSGTITAPSGYAVGLADRFGSFNSFNRNALPFSVNAGQTGIFELRFTPEAAGSYNGNLAINSNAANHPLFNLPLTGSAYLPPVISLSTLQLYESLASDETGSESFLISNTGAQTLDYEMQLVELRRQDSQIHSASERNITGSTLVLNTDSYVAGTSADWTFTVTNQSPDWEWLEDIYLTFPAGVTVHSATSFVGGDGGSIAPVFSSGDGITIHWDGSSNDFEVIFPAQSAVATVHVSISPSFGGILNLPYQINGDGYGAEPHALTGNIALSQEAAPLPWLNLNSYAGSLAPGGSASVTAAFSAMGLTTGDYLASILVNSNDPIHPQMTISVLLEVNHTNTAPIIDIPAGWSLYQDSVGYYDLTAYASDAEGDELTWSFSGNSHIGLSFDGSTLTATPEPGWHGFETVTITVSDGYLQASDTWDIVVEHVINSLDTPVVTISVAGANLVLEWQDVPDAMYYRVFASSDPYAGYDQIDSTNLSHYELPLTAARAFYKVTAVHTPPIK